MCLWCQMGVQPAPGVLNGQASGTVAGAWRERLAQVRQGGHPGGHRGCVDREVQQMR